MAIRCGHVGEHQLGADGTEARRIAVEQRGRLVAFLVEQPLRQSRCIGIDADVSESRRGAVGRFDPARLAAGGADQTHRLALRGPGRIVPDGGRRR
ncbi:MAG: hypothetical protein MUC36_28170, partial [Planctomycetes bacterium]|nr:hypothetical protein [Planctomycetota bacterium]